jgi:hypothetical protein
MDEDQTNPDVTDDFCTKCLQRLFLQVDSLSFHVPVSSWAARHTAERSPDAALSSHSVCG